MSETTSQKRWVPKDGPGPRGGIDCYYTSRPLKSTFRYVKFVRKLRALEEDERIGDETRLKETKEKQVSDFFLRSDRRSLLNSVTQRVGNLMQSYEDDLNEKRKRLKDLFTCEEQENIKKLVLQAQAGAEAAWQDKMDRLQYLLEKRRKEHEAKYKKLPLSNSVQLLSTINKLRAKETQETQMYQIREKQARKTAEREFERMWHEVAMKEAEALSARMEYEAIVKAQKDLECKDHTLQQIEMRRLQRERDRELLKEEAKRFKSIWESDLQKDNEEQQRLAERKHAVAAESRRILEQTMARNAEEEAKRKLIDAVWDSLADQQLADDRTKVELRKRRERELVLCNKELLQLKKQYGDIGRRVDDRTEEEARRLQDKVDRQRCEFRARFTKINEESRKGLLEQIRCREEERVRMKQKIAEDNERVRREILSGELQKLVQQRLITKAQAKKLYGQELLKQIDESKLMKEQSKKEESEFLLPEYTNDGPDAMKRMSKPFVSDVHPFKKVMDAGIAKREKCPCSPPDYCK